MAKLYLRDQSTAALADHPHGLLAVCLAATTGWALRAADGLITTGIINLAQAEPQADTHCDLKLANWLRDTDRHAGPIAAISLVRLPLFLSIAMHPACANTLQAWTAQRGNSFYLVSYKELLSDGSEVADPAASAKPRNGRYFSPACHSEALAIIALERLITSREGTV